MTDLQQELSGQIDRLITPIISGKHKTICLIDPPSHANVGDNAILIGELDYIERLFPDATVFFYDVKNYSSSCDLHIEDATMIAFHGGGNFGDIWPRHQNLRNKILERFSHKPIIQFPQSIHFDSLGELEKTVDLVSKQSDFTMIVRDTRSQEFAEKHFRCPVVLAPDMAFSMQPISRNVPSVDFFCLLRQDKEVAIDHGDVTSRLQATGKTVEVSDWLDEPKTFVAWLDMKMTGLSRNRPRRARASRPLAMKTRRAFAAQRLARGVDLLSRGSVVVTDRLHAHILCTLLKIPHFMFDSYDRKISALHETWTKSFEGASLVDSVHDLDRRLRQIDVAGK